MELSEVLEQIAALKAELTFLLPMPIEQENLLRKKLRLEFNYNSNHIEGNTLTYGETELLLIFDETRGNHPHRDYEEMKASDVALEMIQQLAQDKERPLTESFIKNLNEIILVRPYWKDAITPDGISTRRQIKIGDYKEYPNSVRLPNGERFEYASPGDTRLLMSELIEWLRNEETENSLHAVEIAALLHYKFVRIHPFDDGNGRLSRLLMNYVLLKNNYPPVIIKSEDKRNYLSALHDADVGNIDSFKLYVAKQLVWSMELTLKAAKKESLEEKEDWKKRLQLIERQLSDTDSLVKTQSLDVVSDAINQRILTFAINIIDSLSEFDGLFLSRNIILIFSNRNELKLSRDLVLKDDIVKAHFLSSLRLRLSFDDFRKNIDNPFSVSINFTCNFYKVKYEIRINEMLLFTKLYHQEFTSNDIQIARNEIGRIVIEQIEKNVAS